MASTYCLSVEFCVKPERIDEFLANIRQNQRGSLAEPLCKEYTWGRSVDDPYTFHFHEKFEGKEGNLAHQKTPHFAEWLKLVETDPFSKPPVISVFEAIDP